jgi:hypothetical protein
MSISVINRPTTGVLVVETQNLRAAHNISGL